ncbi:hypothetical protein [Vacuolonema iberomarrocanum]
MRTIVRSSPHFSRSTYELAVVIATNKRPHLWHDNQRIAITRY